MSRRQRVAFITGGLLAVLWAIGTFVAPDESEDGQEVATERTTTTADPTTTIPRPTSPDSTVSSTTSSVRPTTTSPPPSTTTTAAARPPRPAVLRTVEVDRNQINYYAVASSPTADFAAEALTCSNQGKRDDNERYCYVFPTQEAFDVALVDEDSGEFQKSCWMAFGGAGVGRAEATPDDIYTSERWAYDLEGCPQF